MMADLFGPALKKVKVEGEESSDKVCCTLPFALQDLCLLAIVSHLDNYQAELLAKMPLELRRQLLSILPALDLCRLEHTPVAAEVDVNEIWKSRPAPSASTNLSSQGSLQLHISSSSQTCSNSRSTLLLKSAFSDKYVVPQGKEVLFSVVSDFFADSKPEPSFLSRLRAANKSIEPKSYGKTIQKLSSIEGRLVFRNLKSGSKCKNSLCGKRVWKNQATALDVQKTFQTQKVAPTFSSFNSRFRIRPSYAVTEEVLLTPRYRRFALNEHDHPLKLLSTIAKDCSLQPDSAFVDIEFIYSSLLPERLVLDSGSSFASDKLSWTSTLNHILSKVEVLKLQCDDYSKFRVMTGVIESSQGYSQLKILFCSMPDLYLDVIQPFHTLFSLQNFHHLTLELDKLSPFMLCQLLHGFMTVQCSHQQTLTIDVKHSLALPNSFEPAQLASLNKEDTPSSSIIAEYKEFKLFPQSEYLHILYLLLQLPSIRLKKITFLDFFQYREYFHLCSLHPDLQATKLVIDLSDFVESPTIQTDLTSLLGLRSLQKIFITGNWGEFDEIKLGLVQGLRRRSHFLPLKKITLQLRRSNRYKIKDIQQLFEAIFSLPDLHNLKLVLGKGFVDLIRQRRYEDILYKSWERKSYRVKLKSIYLQARKSEFRRIQHITQELTFGRVQKFFSQEFNFVSWAGSDYDNDSDSNDHFYDPDDDF